MEEPHLSLELKEDLLQEEPIILVGKIITDKPVQKRQVINFVSTTWKPIINGFRISYLGKINTYACQFKFAEDADKILGMAPWFIDGNLLLLQRWELRKSFDDLSFNLCPFWIQIHGLPRSYFTKNNAKTIGGSLGTFVSVEGLGVDSPVCSYLRLRIVLDITKPLKKCFSVKGKDGNIIRWAWIKYERLGSICFICKKLGHVMIDCGETEPSKTHLGVDMRTGSTRRVPEAEEKLRTEVSQKRLQEAPLSSRNTDISQPEKINIQERSLETCTEEHIFAPRSFHRRNMLLQIEKQVKKQFYGYKGEDEDDDDDNDESEDEDEDEDDDDDDDDDDYEDEDEDDKDEEEVVYVSGRSKQNIIEKETPDVVFKPSATSAHGDDDVDETGLVDRDIKIVMKQADVPRSRAAKALKAEDGDLVEAIMKLVT